MERRRAPLSNGPYVGQAQPVDLCQGALPLCQQPVVVRVSYGNFFSDMPWLNIPRDRETTFIPPRRLPGGLLGGSGAPPKMSKLQALAAARKKKAEDRKSGDDKTKETGETLEKLSLQENRQPAPQTESAAKRRRLDGVPGLIQKQTTAQCSPDSLAPSDSEQPESSMNVDGPANIDLHEPPTESRPVPLARPSAFAQALLGNASGNSSRAQLESFQYPYLALSPSCVQDAFSDPSPDDKVLAAQAKGSLTGKVKK